MNIIAVGEAFGKWPHEVLELTPDEYSYILAFYKIRQKEMEEQRKNAEAKARARPRGRR